VLERLAGDVPADALVVANTLPYSRTVQVVTDVALREPTDQVRALDPEGAELEVRLLEGLELILGDELLASRDLHRILNRIHGRELFGQQIESRTWADGQLGFVVAEVPEGEMFDLSVLRAEIEAASQQPGPWHVTTTARPRRRVSVDVPVPPLGHTTVRLGAGSGRRGSSDDDVLAVLGHGGLAALHSPLLDATVHQDGTLRVIAADGTVLDGVGRLVDEGDRGDAYNFGPCARGRAVDTPRPISASDVRVHCAGPRRATVRYARTYDLPVGLSTDPDERDSQTEELTVVTEVELRAGEPFVRITTSFVNTVADHRLRLHVATGASGSPLWSWASSAFTVTRRGRTGEAGWGEFPLPTFPAETFVSAASATVLTDRITEFELIDRGGSADLALTLVRAVGLMSVNVHPLRDEPAGSQIPVPGAQYLGRRVTTRLAVLPGAGSPAWRDMQAPRWADVFRHAGLARRGLGPIGGPLRPAASGPELGGADALLTSLRPIPGGSVEARVVALSPVPTMVPFDLGDDARRTDLRGRPTDDVSSGVLELGPWEIGTVRATRRTV
jgi:mannosylglycerate hydrolase